MFRRLPGDQCGRTPTVSRISREYKMNDVSAAEDPMAFLAKVLSTICFIAMPQQHRSCEY